MQQIIAQKLTYVSMHGRPRHKDSLTAVTPKFTDIVTCWICQIFRRYG